ncbi:MAG TPA: hypothetical protein VKE29_04685 [Candidatus Udaeobacter sp.]|nr:hypothetical protein [Candidatus Udaeobacter sp.]
MNPEEQNQWLVQHIPHRLRACLAFSEVQKELMPDTADQESQRKYCGSDVLALRQLGRRHGLVTAISTDLQAQDVILAPDGALGDYL